MKLAKLGDGNPGPRSRELRPSGEVTGSVHYNWALHRWSQMGIVDIILHRTATHSLTHSKNYAPSTMGQALLVTQY